MDWHKPVDIYCERLTPEFWAEPLNALTNFAFILAAVFVFALWRDKGAKKWDIKLLILLTVIVGIGSFIFHTVATSGAMLADVIPIIIFIHFAIWAIFRRVFGQKWWVALACTLVFALFNAAVLKIFGRTMFNGSIQYMPTLALLLGVGAYSYLRKWPVTREFLIASGAFTIAMTCRSLDMMVCETLPIGLHFIWHTLNAVTMYYVMKGLLKSGAKA